MYYKVWALIWAVVAVFECILALTIGHHGASIVFAVLSLVAIGMCTLNIVVSRRNPQ